MESVKPLENKRVLVTGGTGSLGQTLVRRLLTGELGRPAKITVYSRDEAKQHYMRLDYMHRKAATDDVMFHAAALKQVPSCEYFPVEAVQTNIGGAANLVRAIRENDLNVEKVIGI